MKHAIGLAFLFTISAVGAALAQTCTETCSMARCTARDSCEAAYARCLADAGGDPDAEALCLQQRGSCLTAADDTYVGCVGPCMDSCVYFGCSYGFGMEYTRCNDQFKVCLMFQPLVVCQPLFLDCVARARASYRGCVLNCATPCPTVPVARETWGRVKQLFRD